jgi:hypothetical protein
MENGLKFGAQFSADNKDNRQLEFQPTYALSDPFVSTSTLRMNNIRTNSFDRRNNDFNFDAQLTGEYERTFGSHLFHGLLGYEQRQTTFDGNSAQRQGAYSNLLQLPGNG